MPDLATQADFDSAHALKSLLVDRIHREGPITFRDWMETALYHPTAGYYSRQNRKRWGREGDYRTNPERSELFAATFARYFVSLHQQLNKNAPVTILECGAGDGAFAQGVLSSLRETCPDLLRVTRYLIDEISEDSRQRVRKNLIEFEQQVEFWNQSQLDDAIVFSNELLDAFPVHRVQVLDGQLCELRISVDSTGGFHWTTDVPSNRRLSEFVENRGLKLCEGQIIEINLAIEDWFQKLAGRLLNGYLVTVDYGEEADTLYSFPQRPKGTLRGFRAHTFVEDILSAPGEYDITASVDWSFVKAVGSKYGFEVIDFDRQDRFLLDHGLTDVLEDRLAKLSSDVEKIRLTTAAREMILPGEMASHFSVLVQHLTNHGRY